MFVAFVQGGKILTGGSVIESEGNFVQPTIVEISPNANIVKEELFGPVLYVMKFQASFFSFLSESANLVLQPYSHALAFLQTLKEAIDINNSVPQGLSSAIFTRKPEIIFKWIG